MNQRPWISFHDWLTRDVIIITVAPLEKVLFDAGKGDSKINLAHYNVLVAIFLSLWLITFDCFRGHKNIAVRKKLRKRSYEIRGMVL
jgi:hypothetical protein